MGQTSGTRTRYEQSCTSVAAAAVCQGYELDDTPLRAVFDGEVLTVVGMRPDRKHADLIFHGWLPLSMLTEIGRVRAAPVSDDRRPASRISCVPLPTSALHRPPMGREFSRQ